MENITICPACGSDELQPFITSKDFTVSHETFTIKKCINCNLGITTPRPSESNLGEYYKSDEYISHSGKSSGISLLYKIVRSHSLRQKEKLLLKYTHKGKVLDYGCGTGDFVKTLNSQGWASIGVEPSEAARGKAIQTNGEIIFSSIDALEEDNFSAITLWHVLEHIPNLNDILAKLVAKTSKKGALIIAVPNYLSMDAEYYHTNWAGYDVPRHLWHFSEKNISLLLSKHGMKIVEILPMKFDSYYVSMLSEKYKANNKLTITCFLKGLLQGLKSNLKASKTKNYSSLIYIAKYL